MITIEVNGRPVEAKSGEMLLTALRRAHVHVPTLCHMEGMFPSGACRMCVVEVAGAPNLVPSCACPVRDGMKIQTHGERALRARKTIVELLLADHPDDCLYCDRNSQCDLQDLAAEYGVRSRRYAGGKRHHKKDLSSPALVRDPDKCILCGKCVRVCEEMQGIGAIDFVGRGSNTHISVAFEDGLNLSSCIFCGQCVVACPTGALAERSHIKEVMEAIADPEKIVVVQNAPSVSITLGEAFGLKPGTDVNGLMAAALRRIGFEYVFDTSFSADLTVMEEASELVKRIVKGERLPLMTSCSPGWIKYVEQFYPEFIPNLSTCKSPQQMLGAVLKTYFAEKNGIDPRNVFDVAVMPCIAKKFESGRPEMMHDGLPDVDAVLTTRELVQMIRMRHLDFNSLKPEPMDLPFGERSTAGKLFGASGGVTEAAIRTAHYLITGQDMDELKVEAVRGINGHKEMRLQVGGLDLGIAVVSGLKNAHDLLEEVRRGRRDLHFIEVMTCPGGCINGGGQLFRTDTEALRARMQSLYAIDRNEPVRTAHANNSVKQLYADFLGEPLGEKSHALLHTHYGTREVMK
ncbi:MAG: NADH:ubiquinone oxidoreductase [Candidatus Hydrogenedentota bacterium]